MDDIKFRTEYWGADGASVTVEDSRGRKVAFDVGENCVTVECEGLATVPHAVLFEVVRLMDEYRVRESDNTGPFNYTVVVNG